MNISKHQWFQDDDNNNDEDEDEEGQQQSMSTKNEYGSVRSFHDSSRLNEHDDDDDDDDTLDPELFMMSDKLRTQVKRGSNQEDDNDHTELDRCSSNNNSNNNNNINNNSSSNNSMSTSPTANVKRPPCGILKLTEEEKENLRLNKRVSIKSIGSHSHGARRSGGASIPLNHHLHLHSSRPDSPHSVGMSTCHSEHFKDIEETGKWGTITKKEIIAVAVCMVMVAIAIIVVVVLFVVQDHHGKASYSSSSSSLSPPTLAPTRGLPTFASPQEKYGTLVQILRNNSLMEPDLANWLPTNLNELPGLYNDSTMDPRVRAASWLMNVDHDDTELYLRDRFALAVLYYATGGPHWMQQTNWMTSVSLCSWERISCNTMPYPPLLKEMDLSNNGLTGTVPTAVSLLSELGVLWLNGNNLTGTIPGTTLGSLPHLFILYLQDNQFTGDIPVSLIKSGSLGTCRVVSFLVDACW